MKRLLKRLLKPIVVEILREERSKDVMPTYMSASFLNAIQEEIVAVLSRPGLPADTAQDQDQAQVQGDPEDSLQSDPKPSP
ncbi:hypothetical protein [Pseudomonas sp.]|uniref:hypothetical protein n=1 Tax=Pseudomonas sp. TaxID=306 RepID=UPI003D13E1AE